MSVNVIVKLYAHVMHLVHLLIIFNVEYGI